MRGQVLCGALGVPILCFCCTTHMCKLRRGGPSPSCSGRFKQGPCRPARCAALPPPPLAWARRTPPAFLLHCCCTPTAVCGQSVLLGGPPVRPGQTTAPPANRRLAGACRRPKGVLGRFERVGAAPRPWGASSGAYKYRGVCARAASPARLMASPAFPGAHASLLSLFCEARPPCPPPSYYPLLCRAAPSCALHSLRVP